MNSCRVVVVNFGGSQGFEAVGFEETGTDARSRRKSVCACMETAQSDVKRQQEILNRLEMVAEVAVEEPAADDKSLVMNMALRQSLETGAYVMLVDGRECPSPDRVDKEEAQRRMELLV